MTKTCFDCAHIRWYSGSPGYSEMTPGYDAEIFCGKHHWEIDNTGDELSTVRKKFQMAETCPDFEEERHP